MTDNKQLSLHEIAKDPAKALSDLETSLGVEPGTLLDEMEALVLPEAKGQ